MKKTIFLSLPLISVMLFTGCRKKVTPADLGEVLPLAVASLEKSLEQDAIGATLTGSMDMNLYQKMINYDSNWNFSSFGEITEQMRMTNLKMTAAMKQMNGFMRDVTGSGNISSKVELDINTNDINPEYTSIQPAKFNGTIQGNAYLQNNIMYLDHNEDFAGLVNTFILLNTGTNGTDSSKYKYYLPLPIEGNPSLTYDIIMPWFDDIKTSIYDAIKNIPAEVEQTFTAVKYSKTRYGLTMAANIFDLYKNFGLNTMFGSGDQATGQVKINFDTTKGIEDITYQYDIDYQVTVGEQYADYQDIIEQMRGHLNEPAVSSKGNVDMKISFSYGSKVRVSTLKDTSTYNTPFPTGGSGGSAQPGVIEISTDDFINYFQKMDDNNVVPKVAFYDGYYDGSDSGYSESFIVYNGDYSNLTDDQSYLTLFPREFSNRDVLIQMLETDTTTSYRCYMGGDSFELEANQVGGDGYIEFSFNQKGHVTRFYLVSEGYKLNVNVSYAY